MLIGQQWMGYLSTYRNTILWNLFVHGYLSPNQHSNIFTVTFDSKKHLFGYIIDIL